MYALHQLYWLYTKIRYHYTVRFGWDVKKLILSTRLTTNSDIDGTTFPDSYKIFRLTSVTEFPFFRHPLVPDSIFAFISNLDTVFIQLIVFDFWIGSCLTFKGNCRLYTDVGLCYFQSDILWFVWERNTNVQSKISFFPVQLKINCTLTIKRLWQIQIVQPQTTCQIVFIWLSISILLTA